MRAYEIYASEAVYELVTKSAIKKKQKLQNKNSNKYLTIFGNGF